MHRAILVPTDPAAMGAVQDTQHCRYIPLGSPSLVCSPWGLDGAPCRPSPVPARHLLGCKATQKGSRAGRGSPEPCRMRRWGGVGSVRRDQHHCGSCVPAYSNSRLTRRGRGEPGFPLSQIPRDILNLNSIMDLLESLCFLIKSVL